MKSKRSIHTVLVPIFVTAVVISLASCKQAEKLDEAASTLEAKLKLTVEAEKSPAATESSADVSGQEAAEEQTTAAVPAAESTTEPTATVVPVFTVTQMEEYASVTEFFRVMVPAGWSSEESFPGGAFVMANSEAALGRFKTGSAVESGDLILNVGFLPFELFRQREVVPLNIQFDAAPDVFMQSLMPIFHASGDVLLSDVELVSIDNGREAGMLTVSGGGREGLILMFMAGEEVVGVVSSIGFPGEQDAAQETIYAVSSGVSFSGAHGALYGTLLEG